MFGWIAILHQQKPTSWMTSWRLALGWGHVRSALDEAVATLSKKFSRVKTRLIQPERICARGSERS
ncbi:hypothetical protein MGEO_07795 [Marivita geojedonensis]|uniref:Uncharacterized protein n=1 Tax=Marivita geojedonensis TaxID=1123756 RepID=A0A1X4NLX6_9RHOB|nr:hypothetical protein MGEO_07795 [Marivita geojedonensis]